MNINIEEIKLFINNKSNSNLIVKTIQIVEDYGKLIFNTL